MFHDELWDHFHVSHMEIKLCDVLQLANKTMTQMIAKINAQIFALRGGSRCGGFSAQLPRRQGMLPPLIVADEGGLLRPSQAGVPPPRHFSAFGGTQAFSGPLPLLSAENSTATSIGGG